MKLENQEKWDWLMDRIVDPKRKKQVNNFVKFLEDKTNYFKAPASPKYHANWEEGLLEHSINVAMNAIRISRALKTNIPEESLIICGLFHDLGKCIIDDGEFYYLKKEPTEKQKQWGYIQYPPYGYNDADQCYMNVPLRAVRLLTQFVDITDEEYIAILCHDGQYVDDNKFISTKEPPMLLIIQFADLWSGFVVEGIDKQDEDGKGVHRVAQTKVGKMSRKIRVNQSMAEDYSYDLMYREQEVTDGRS